MQSISVVVVVAANSVDDDILKNNRSNQLAGPSRVVMYATSGGSDVNATLLIGNEVFLSDQTVNPGTSFPTTQDNFVAEGVGGAGEKIVVSVRNANAAARTFRMLMLVHDAW